MAGQRVRLGTGRVSIDSLEDSALSRLWTGSKLDLQIQYFTIVIIIQCMTNYYIEILLFFKYLRQPS